SLVGVSPFPDLFRYQNGGVLNTINEHTAPQIKTANYKIIKILRMRQETACPRLIGACPRFSGT
ncbi:hypothetical protein ACFL5L_06405, partial [candidate division KSB1 bacterium]